MRTLLSIFSIAGIALLVACGNSTNQASKTAQPVPTAELTYETYDSLFVHPDCKDDEKVCSHYQVGYPQLTGGAASKVLQKINDRIRFILLRNNSFSSHRKAAEVVFGSYDKMSSDFPGEKVPEHIVEHGIEKPGTIGNILVCTHHVYTYQGGAHGNYVNTYLNFDLTDGKLLELSDILDSTNTFIDTAQHYAQLSLNGEQATSSTYDDFYQGDAFYVPGNFRIGKKGITFQYKIYEIASYAEGEIRFSVPYAALQPFLKEDYQYLLSL